MQIYLRIDRAHLAGEKSFWSFSRTSEKNSFLFLWFVKLLSLIDVLEEEDKADNVGDLR